MASVETKVRAQGWVLPPQGRVLPLKRALALVGAAAVVAGLTSGTAVGLIARSAHYTVVSAGSVNEQAAQDFNINAGHVRLIGRDGNLELEHSAAAATEDLRSYDVGTSTRTPIQVGFADGQDLISLIVAGSANQKHDLQQWTSGTKVVAAVDQHGGFRIGKVTLSTTLVRGVPYLIARTAAGKTYRLRLSP